MTVIPGGWLNHHWIQVVYQLCDSITGFTYSFVLTFVILYVMNWIPGLSIRASEEAEIEGIDEAEIGEFAYDFVEKQGDYGRSSQGMEAKITSSSSSYLTTEAESSEA
jgi:ammonium transporter, Amt family